MVGSLADWGTAGTAVLALFAAGLATRATIQTNRAQQETLELQRKQFQVAENQAHFQLALSLHHDLTTGEVAKARDVLGAIQHADEDVKGVVSNADAVESYFTVLWCFERIYAGEQTLRSDSNRLQDTVQLTPALKFMYDSIHWHVDEWNYILDVIRQELESRLEGISLDDQHSSPKLSKLVEALKSAGYEIRDRKKAEANVIRSPPALGGYL
jgi:hypothetical protein